MSPETLLSFRVAQVDIVVCWVIYILKAMTLPTAITALLITEHYLSKSIRWSESKWKLHRMKKDGDEP